MKAFSRFYASTLWMSLLLSWDISEHNVGSCISEGMIPSILYTQKKGLSPIGGSGSLHKAI